MSSTRTLALALAATAALALVTVGAVNGPTYEAAENQPTQSQPDTGSRPEVGGGSSQNDYTWLLAAAVVGAAGYAVVRYLTTREIARLALMLAAAALVFLAIAPFLDPSGATGGELAPGEVIDEVADRPTGRSGLPTGALLAVAVTAVIATALLIRRRTEADPVVTEQDLDQAIVTVLDDVESVQDRREAIVTAYARLELALAEIGAPRRPSETSREHLARVLGRSPAARTAMEDLGSLYEHARFDAAPVTAAMRTAAIAALNASRTAVGTAS